MKMKYISQIKSNLKQYKTIRTRQVSSHLLDGSYRSRYKGKSLNFDELREYVVGDDAKDVDWKASARSQKLLVKQYIAEKKHNIMLVPDTNKRMLADTKMQQEKRETAILAAGTLAYLVWQNGDEIGGIFHTQQSIQYVPFKTELMNIEMILDAFYKNTTMDNHSNLNDVLDYLVHHLRKNMILVLVTDLWGIREISESLLKQLLTMNDILVLCMEDAGLSGSTSGVYSLEQKDYLPCFFTKDKKLAAIYEARQKEVYEECVRKLKKYGISYVMINQIEEVEEKIIELFTGKQYK